MLRREKRPILFDGIYPDNIVNKEKKEQVEKKTKKISSPKLSKKEKGKILSRKKHILKVFLTVFVTLNVLLILFLAGVYLTFGSFYKERVLPGVYVLGEHVGGKYGTELKKEIREKLDKTKISFKVGEKEELASLYELGVLVDSEAAAIQAEQFGKLTKDTKNNIFSRLLSFGYWLSPEYYSKFFENQTVDLSYTVNRDKVSDFSKKIFEKYKTPEKNASVIIKGSDIEVLPAQYGEKIIVDSLERQVKDSLDKLKYGQKIVVGISKEKVTPNIKEEGLQETVSKTKAITDKKVVLKFEDKIYVLGKDTVATWINFEEGNGTIIPKVDQSKVESYLKKIAVDIDVMSLPRKVRVENGVKEIVEEEGKEGRALGIAGNAGEIKYALENGVSAVNHNLKVSKVEPRLIKNRVLIADWVKYIDLDLSAQRMTAYENKNPVFSDLITSGKRGWETPVGTYLIYGKTRAQTMKGGTGSEYYNLPNVQWISWFNGAIAIHGAYWRSNFGASDYIWSGSHGCINARNSSAEWIYNWAPTGTPVVVHY